MQYKDCFHAVDKMLRNVRKVEKSFSSIPVIYGNNFAQCLPIMEDKGIRMRTVNTCIRKSFLWHDIEIFHLKQNMRVREDLENRIFADWLKTMPYKEDQQGYIGFPPQIRQITSAEELINRIFPEQIMQTANDNPDFFNGRVIFAVHYNIVREVNSIVVRKLPGLLTVSRAVNKIIGYGNNTELEEIMGKEITILVNTKSLPPAELELKIGIPVILLRNYNSTDNLCNGARIIVSRIKNNRLFCIILKGSRIS